MAATRATGRCPGCATRSGSCSRRPCCSPARSPRTSPTARRPRARRSSRRAGPPERTTSSPARRAATTSRSAPRAAACPAASARARGGYAEPLGPRGVGLPGGQRQRLGIARVLLRTPPILLLDEPTTGLDALSEANLVGSLRELMRGRTTIIVTHSMALAANADRVLVVEAGRIVQDGTPAALLAERGPFRRMTVEQTIERPPAPAPALLPAAVVADGAGWRARSRRALGRI